MIGDIKKFSFAEMTSNDNGKTSGSGTMGILAVSIGTIIFAYAAFCAAALVNPAVTVIGIGAALLGVRKWQQNQANEQDNDRGTSDGDPK
jgi:hypothetical protein